MTTTFFIGSFIAICAMIGAKILESYTGKVSVISVFFDRTDNLIYRFIDLSIYKYNRWKKISKIFLFEFLPVYIYEQAAKLKNYMAKKYYMTGDELRGKKNLRNTGSVSGFLKNITDGAEANKR